MKAQTQTIADALMILSLGKDNAIGREAAQRLTDMEHDLKRAEADIEKLRSQFNDEHGKRCQLQCVCSDLQKDNAALRALLQQMLDVAENCDETGYVDGVGFVDVEAQDESMRIRYAKDSDFFRIECSHLRADNAALRAERDLWEKKCHELIAPHYILDPDLRAAKFRDALAYHPVLSRPRSEAEQARAALAQGGAK